MYLKRLKQFTYGLALLLGVTGTAIAQDTTTPFKALVA
jgi:hypothetical protein